MLRELALYLDLPLSTVQNASEKKTGDARPFILPARAAGLTDSQRKVVLSVVDEFLRSAPKP